MGSWLQVNLIFNSEIGSSTLTSKWRNNCFVFITGGIIDQDYEGEIKVILFNHGENEFKVSKGMRIAQLLFARCSIVELIETLKRPSPQENEISQEEVIFSTSFELWKPNFMSIMSLFYTNY